MPYNLVQQCYPIRVCFLNNDFGDQTGSGRFCSSLVEALAGLDTGAQCRVLARDSFPKGKLAALRMLFHLRRIANDFDVIHALDGWPYGVMAVLALLGLGKKVVITAVGTGAVKPLHQPFKRRLLTWAYRRADKVVAVSNNTRQEILRVIPNLGIEVINHGVDFAKFQVPPKQMLRIATGQASSKFQDIENLKPYILSVGALKKRKGYEYSIKAFAKVSERFPDLKYIIVGEGPEWNNIQFLISNFPSSAMATEGKQLRDRVVIFHKVDEDLLIALYKNAELFILLPQDDNKDMEGFGLVFLEAAACGLPVVATRDSGAQDAVLDQKNGILVPQDDHREVAAALSRILTKGDLRGCFSAESKAIAAEMSWDKVALLYQNIYSTLIT